MRKNALAMSIATLIGGLGFVGAASADVIPGTLAPGAANLGAATADTLAVSNGGIGHSLLVPYFNAQNGNATIISLTNTDTLNGKVVKVRFRGASNSDDILDFTVLMSPGDIWNATVTAPTADGPAQIVTQDRTCTLPQLAAGVAQPFITNRLTTKGGTNMNANTREGYVEIFNMADIPNLSVYAPGGTSQSALFLTTKHTAGVPTCNSATINTAILNQNYQVADEAVAASRGLATPTTGLFGNWVILNVPQTTTYSGEMVAVRATVGAGGPDGRANFVVFPQNDAAYGGVINNVTADPLLRTVSFATKDALGVTGGATAAAAIPAANFDLPDMSTPYVVGVVDPLAQAATLTAALAVTSIINEYATDPIITAKTDWVFSMPTRRYSVAMDYAPTTSRRLYSTVPAGAVAQYFHDGNTAINPGNLQQICVRATGQVFYDREETTKSSGAVFSPGSVSVTQFCGETSVLSFADAAGQSVLGGTIARQDTGSSAFTNGWGNVNVLGGNGLGLPILGGSFIKGTNPSAGAGFAGTYGITSAHRFTR